MQRKIQCFTTVKVEEIAQIGKERISSVEFVRDSIEFCRVVIHQIAESVALIVNCIWKKGKGDEYLKCPRVNRSNRSWSSDGSNVDFWKVSLVTDFILEVFEEEILKFGRVSQK